ncbi:hypothetical protein DE146DRAFT_634606 [Phaeosphaeria sp. MPI-PUGE-AT-0046c]|nr:hypothetical protein DE146DRAFT_634606 [Phaeosphaeria sp. MPI-PUGE-AT-0046c]
MLISVILLWVLPLLTLALKAKSRHSPLLPQSKHHGQCTARHRLPHHQQLTSKVHRRSSRHGHECPTHHHHHTTEKTRYHHGKSRPALSRPATRPAMLVYFYKGEPLRGSYPILPDQTALPTATVSSASTSTITAWVTTMRSANTLISSSSTFDSDAFLDLDGSLRTSTSSIRPALSGSSSIFTTKVSSSVMASKSIFSAEGSQAAMSSTSTEAAVAPLDNTLQSSSSVVSSTTTSSNPSSSFIRKSGSPVRSSIIPVSPSLVTASSPLSRPSSTSSPYVCAPSSRVCVTALPDGCQFGDINGFRLYSAINLCVPSLAALKLDCLTQEAVETCFSPFIDESTVGIGMEQCIEATIICGTSSSGTRPASSLPSTMSTTRSSISSATFCSPQPSASPVGPCLSSLPRVCQVLAGQSGPQIFTYVNLCRSAVQDLGYPAPAQDCGPIVNTSQKGDDLIRCLSLRTPVCDSCVEAMPSECTSFYGDTSVLSGNTMAACQAALGDAAAGFSVQCFIPRTRDFSDLTGTNVEACLRQNLRVCSGGTSNSGGCGIAPVASSISIPSLSTGSIPSPSCLPDLPSPCQTIDLQQDIQSQFDPILFCSVQLINLGFPTIDCFTLPSGTGADMMQCVRNNVYLCDGTSSSSLVTESTQISAVPLEISSPSSTLSSIPISSLSLSLSASPTPTPTPSSSCLWELPFHCQGIDPEIEVTSQLMDILFCQFDLFFGGVTDLAYCFQDDTDIGADVIQCLRDKIRLCEAISASSTMLLVPSSTYSSIPSSLLASPTSSSSSSCLERLPLQCEIPVDSETDGATIDECRVKLNAADYALASICFDQAYQGAFSGGRQFPNCLGNNLHICVLVS